MGTNTRHGAQTPYSGAVGLAGGTLALQEWGRFDTVRNLRYDARNTDDGGTMGTEAGDWLTTEEAAARLRVSTRTIRKWIERGELPAWKAGKDWRVAPDDLQRYIEAHKNT